MALAACLGMRLLGAAPLAVATALIATPTTLIVVFGAGFPALAADLSHMLTVFADLFAALATGLGMTLRVAMPATAFALAFAIRVRFSVTAVGSFPAFTGDLTPLLLVHGGKAALVITTFLVCHCCVPLGDFAPF